MQKGQAKGYMDKSFQASWGSRLCVLLFVAPCVGLFLWVGFEIAGRQNILIGLIFVLVAGLLSIWIAFMLTMRVDMSDDSIVRTWLLGRKAVPIHDITMLRWGGARGQTILSIMYGKSRRFITLSSIVVSREKLLGIQKDDRRRLGIWAQHGIAEIFGCDLASTLADSL